MVRLIGIARARAWGQHWRKKRGEENESGKADVTTPAISDTSVSSISRSQSNTKEEKKAKKEEETAQRYILTSRQFQMRSRLGGNTLSISWRLVISRTSSWPTYYISAEISIEIDGMQEKRKKSVPALDLVPESSDTLTTRPRYLGLVRYCEPC